PIYGKWIALGAIEPKFYAILIEAMGLGDRDLPDQYDETSWAAGRELFAEIFRGRTQAEWSELLQPLDACFSPVLTFSEAYEHEHNVAHGSFIAVDGIKQPAPAPRFSRTPGEVRRGAAKVGEHSAEALGDWGFEDAEIERLRASGAVA
ncbi:MAG: CoA transferase, partial [Solirubrobacterales bacterium]